MTPAPEKQSRFAKLGILLFYLTVSGTCFAQKTTIYGPDITKDTVTKGFKPKVGSDRYYRIYVGAAYNIVKYRHSKQPYAASHTLGLNYSITENSLHPYYEGLFPQAIGKWAVSVKAGYDGIRRMNYYGLGNETRRQNPDNRFNWLRTHHQYATAGVGRRWNENHQLDLTLRYSGIQVLNDENRFIGKSRQTIDPAEFKWQYFLGPLISYTYGHLNHPSLPTQGIELKGTAGYMENLHRGDHSFARYTADLATYLPLSPQFTFALRTGVATLTGNPDFYQYNAIGGTRTLRGYHWWRFYGKTSFYSQNELRWVVPVSRGPINGHFGLLGFYDLGRVWLPGEPSGKMHYGYGAGIILAPFDRLVFTFMLGISNEDKRTYTALDNMQ